MRRGAPLEERLITYSERVTESGCWLWTGALMGAGYGTTYWSTPTQRGRIISAHRASYQLFVGEVPSGMHVLHRCDVMSCINPAHLFLGTHRENVADMVAKGRARNQNSRRTHCKRGHPLVGANLYVDPKHGRRTCCRCRRITHRAYEQRKKCLSKPQP